VGCVVCLGRRHVVRTARGDQTYTRYNDNARSFRCERVILGVSIDASKPKEMPLLGHFSLDLISCPDV
jgi:hypothetical protein